MNIVHIGKSYLISKSSKSTFTLQDLLHVPSITKNLITISKFVHDNNMFFEFHPNECFVKSKVSKETLLQGTLRDGLYHFAKLKFCTSLYSPLCLGPIVILLLLVQICLCFTCGARDWAILLLKLLNLYCLIVIFPTPSIKCQILHSVFIILTFVQIDLYFYIANVL